VWIRLKFGSNLSGVSAWFTYAGDDRREIDTTVQKFSGLATVSDINVVGGVIRARGKNKRTLQFASSSGKYYELDEQMTLQGINDPKGYDFLKEHARIPSRKGILEVDSASVLYIDDKGRRFRLPKGDVAYEQPGSLGWGRLDREVATERDLFNCHGTFYELPAENAAGFTRVRPVASHRLRISDYCSYRGLLVMSGIDLKKGESNRHIIRSDDGKTALWIGSIDDVWELGKPVGHGGPWKKSSVKVGEWSDPYLMTGYDRKTLHLESTQATTIAMEVDITGMGDWKSVRSFSLDEAGTVDYEFPAAFQAYWVRFASAKDSTVSAQLSYR